MTLKIIGGTFRNRSLKTPKGPQTRPSLAIMRKAVFDILQQDVIEKSVLDLFAGAGAIGLEALSRGASHATFVDKDRYALACIEENIRTLKVENQTEIIRLDVIVALEKLSKAKRQFDLIYIDPPYATSPERSLIPKILALLESLHLLKQEAIVFAEEAAPGFLDPKNLNLHDLKWLNSRQFSRSVLHQLRS